jgi:hypothetical protein
VPPEIEVAWGLILRYYLFTVLMETPILLVGLSRRHTIWNRLIAGVWLTACTYPIVFIVLPQVVWVPLGRAWYLAVAETFAPLAECLLFRLAYGRGDSRLALWRDYAVIVAANLCSFLTGEAISWLLRDQPALSWWMW